MDISKEELYKAIGTKIRAMRTAKGWTQEELGNKFDVSPQYISRISASEIASLPFRSGGLAAAGSRKGMESVLAL